MRGLLFSDALGVVSQVESKMDEAANVSSFVRGFVAAEGSESATHMIQLDLVSRLWFASIVCLGSQVPSVGCRVLNVECAGESQARFVLVGSRWLPVGASLGELRSAVPSLPSWCAYDYHTALNYQLGRLVLMKASSSSEMIARLGITVCYPPP